LPSATLPDFELTEADSREVVLESETAWGRPVDGGVTLLVGGESCLAAVVDEAFLAAEADNWVAGSEEGLAADRMSVVWIGRGFSVEPSPTAMTREAPCLEML
jgi:hypothetical protein